MNREKKIKLDNLYTTAIKNYLIEYEKWWGFKFSLNDAYDKKTIYKYFLINYGLSEKKTRKYLNKVLTNK
jgi:hypothetical protein